MAKAKKPKHIAVAGNIGAGKTTLLRMITGIFYPDSGSIILNGKKFKSFLHL